jgi:hypothetical protein
MKRNVYVLIDEEDVQCFSNLTKLIRNTQKITYFSAYRALQKSNIIESGGVTITKTTLR